MVEHNLLCIAREALSNASKHAQAEAIEIFGVERCMFASNVPPDTLQASFDTMIGAYKAMVADLPREDVHRLFHDNAARFYRLDL